MGSVRGGMGGREVLTDDSRDGIAHGGDLDAARRLFPGAPEPWIDLSTGINPVPYPLPPLIASALYRLPSPADLARLKSAAAEAYGAPGPDHVVAAPGTQILIETLPRLMPPSRVAVVGPTYAEHAAAWTRSGHTVRWWRSAPTIPTGACSRQRRWRASPGEASSCSIRPSPTLNPWRQRGRGPAS